MAAPLRVALFLFVVLFAYDCSGKVNTKNAVLEDVNEFKDFKKLLRTKTNVLVLYASKTKDVIAELKVFREAADAVRGTGTMLFIDCSMADRKKLCKKLKVLPEPFVLKHYKDGDFHKDYDRQLTVTSMVNFMRNPNGDLPWEEDSAGADVIHFTDYAAYARHLKKDMRPLLVMFYVPWCGFCKRLKPDYSKAATELKDKGGYLLGAMDVERQENAPARKVFNLTGFPTILYFEKGQLKRTYDGENNKQGIINFMLDPNSVPVQKAKDDDWSADTDSEIVHLTTQGFEPAIKEENSVLVMFYAPWCGHCKRMKPEYEKAALLLKEKKIPGILAALDATKETAIAEQYKVKGYPTIKYFVNGNYKYDVNLRETNKIIDFMRNPQEPPPPPPPEKPWEEEDTEVLFLNDENFSTTLKRKKHALVMFYAPWCGHCKSTKPEFSAAAKALNDDPRVVFVAIDCTRHTNLCEAHEVRSYPTIKYFSYLKTKSDYNSGRTRQDFIAFMVNPNLGIPISHERDEL